MIVQTNIQDYDLLDHLDTLYFSVEIGELYERDKFKWSERVNFDEEKRKKIDFAFKMNHIKQVVSLKSRIYELNCLHYICSCTLD